jgi:hypothetical protein
VQNLNEDRYFDDTNPYAKCFQHSTESHETEEGMGLYESYCRYMKKGVPEIHVDEASHAQLPKALSRACLVPTSEYLLNESGNKGGNASKLTSVWTHSASMQHQQLSPLPVPLKTLL